MTSGFGAAAYRTTGAEPVRFEPVRFEPVRLGPSRFEPSRRATRGRAAGASVVAGLVAGALPTISGGAEVHAQLLLAGAGMVALCVALLGRAPAFTAAAIAFGGDYALRLTARQRLDKLDALAVAEAVAIFATVELGLRSLDARTVAPPERRVRRSAWWRLIAMLVGAGASAFVVLALGSRRLPAPTVGLALGLAAATTVLVAAEVLRRRVTRSASDH